MSDRVLDRSAGPATGPRAERVRRLAVLTVFAMLGVSEGTWAARIPAIKAGLHLSPGLLGLALLGPAVGCVLAMPATGAVLASVPPRRVAQAGARAAGRDAASDHDDRLGLAVVSGPPGLGRRHRNRSTWP